MKEGALPIVEVLVGNRKMRALVDTGCTDSIIRPGLVTPDGQSPCVVAFDGRRVPCHGRAVVSLIVQQSEIQVDIIVSPTMLPGIDLVLGIDAIQQLGGMSLCNEKVYFGGGTCAAGVSMNEEESLVVEDKDFRAVFDGSVWTVRWKWKNDLVPSLKNRIACYESSLKGNKCDFENEVERWIAEGILKPWKGDDLGLLPLMAVQQENKGKVRPVFDFRELNKSVECHTGDDVMDVCAERLREWRQVAGETVILDLKAAYLQLMVHPSLWRFQLVEFKGVRYCLTRLGFGLSSAPKIMTLILRKVLSLEDDVRRGTSSFIDDILVDVSKVSAKKVRDHLGKYGLITKSPQSLEGGASLGLKIVKGVQGELTFGRGNVLPEELPVRLTRRELFSLCGKMLGHYPVAGWLRLACSYVKRIATGDLWDQDVGEQARRVVGEILDLVKREDPVHGLWRIPNSKEGVVWCDASNVGLGAVVEVGGAVAEDVAWLRKKSDFNHINVAELDAVVKGLNLAIKWGLTKIQVVTDSGTVFGWLNSTLTGQKNIRTKGAAELIIKRRLGVVRNLVEELDLKVETKLVPSGENKADALTRVRAAWLEMGKKVEQGVTCCVVTAVPEAKQAHNLHHLGVDRSYYLAQKLWPDISKGEIQRVVRECTQCQSIDPAPSVHHPGHLSVTRNWVRAALDITHYCNVPYLTLVDCGPSRFAIWRRLRSEGAEEVHHVVQQIFRERGPVEELIMDNAATFKSDLFQQLLAWWQVVPFFRAAFRPSGNGIVERQNRTVKRIAERAGIDPEEAAFWYNISPRSGQKKESVPQDQIFKYTWRQPGEVPDGQHRKCSKVAVGDEVWVKPPRARCTSHWRRGTITGINSDNNVSVDGLPRHILDIRPVVHSALEESGGEESVVEELDVLVPEGAEAETARYPSWVRRPPDWLADYV